MCILINLKEKALIESVTGDIVRPSCFDDLIAYHQYLMTNNRQKEAKFLLKNVYKGEAVISNMIESLQKIHSKV